MQLFPAEFIVTEADGKCKGGSKQNTSLLCKNHFAEQ
jgi:hypothetical protein